MAAMNAAWSQRVSLISALGLPTILSPTIGATTGDRPAARRFGSRLSPALQASSFARRLAHPHRPNRVHGGCPRGQPVLRTGRSRSVALHPALLRRSYGSIPHGSSPHRSGLPPLYPIALSGARAQSIALPSCRVGPVGTRIMRCAPARRRCLIARGTCVEGHLLPK